MMDEMHEPTAGEFNLTFHLLLGECGFPNTFSLHDSYETEHPQWFLIEIPADFIVK